MNCQLKQAACSLETSSSRDRLHDGSPAPNVLEPQRSRLRFHVARVTQGDEVIESIRPAIPSGNNMMRPQAALGQFRGTELASEPVAALAFKSQFFPLFALVVLGGLRYDAATPVPRVGSRDSTPDTLFAFSRDNGSTALQVLYRAASGYAVLAKIVVHISRAKNRLYLFYAPALLKVELFKNLFIQRLLAVVSVALEVVRCFTGSNASLVQSTVYAALINLVEVRKVANRFAFKIQGSHLFSVQRLNRMLVHSHALIIPRERGF